MINLLMEQDLNFYQPILDSHAEAWSTLFGHIHQIVKRTWNEPRLVKEVARNELVWAGWVSSDDLAEDAQVVVESENRYPKSRAASQAFAEAFLQFGPNLQMFPPLLQSRILETLEMGDDRRIRDIYQLDTRWAEYALEKMIGDPERGVEGVDMPVRIGVDDHATILQVVTMFQKTRFFEELPPDAKLRILRYAAGQREALVQGAMLAAAFQGEGPTSNPQEQEQRKESAQQE